MAGRGRIKDKPCKEALVSFGKKLKELREKLKLTQEDMAYDFDVAPLTWSRFETGDSVIYPDIIKKLKQLYNMDCDLFPKKPDDLVSIGERFIRIRDAVNISYDELAKQLSVPPELINGIEKDKRMQIPIVVMMNLLKVYKVNLNWLFSGKGEMFLADASH